MPPARDRMGVQVCLDQGRSSQRFAEARAVGPGLDVWTPTDEWVLREGASSKGWGVWALTLTMSGF